MAPDGSLFWEFGPPTAGDGDTSVFFATWAQGTKGGIVREQADQFELVAELGQATPGAPGYEFFSLFLEEIAADSERVVFGGASWSDAAMDGIDGLYEWTAGNLRKVVDDNTQVPGAPGGTYFEDSVLPALGPHGISWSSGPSLALLGRYREVQHGEIESILRHGDPVVGLPAGVVSLPGAMADRLPSPAIWGNQQLAVKTDDGWRGLLHSGTVIPGLPPGPVLFTTNAPYPPAVTSRGVVVRAGVLGQPFPLYRFGLDGEIEEVVSPETRDPDTGEPIGSINIAVDGSGERIAFEAGPLNAGGLYVHHLDDTSPTLIAREGQTLPDGHTPGLLIRNRFAFADDSLVFLSLGFGDEVIYRARMGPPPEPPPNPLEIPTLGHGVLGLFALLLAAVAFGSLRHERKWQTFRGRTISDDSSSAPVK